MNDVSVSSEFNQLHAGLCSALGDPSRLQIAYALARQPYAVNDLAAVIGLGPSAASRHLRILRDHGIVIARRQGARIEYRLADDRIVQALDLLRLVLRQAHARRTAWLAQPSPTAVEAVS